MRLTLLILTISTSLAQAHDPAPPKAVPFQKIYEPTAMPDRVVLSWVGSPATSQSVNWRTSKDVTTAQAEIARAEKGPGFERGTDAKQKTTTIPATSQTLKSNLGEAAYHTVNFTKLMPKTKYVYRVGDGINWTEWYQFETVSDQPSQLKFIYFGDAQNDIKQHWSRVARGAYSDMPDADFILHAGDLINNAGNDHEWGEWFHASGWINGMVPCLATPGNHEYGRIRGQEKKGLTPHWRPTFALPENGPDGLKETCYFLDIQGVRIISLNSNEMQKEQLPWLEKVLSDNPNKWTVVTFHHPLYSTAKGRDNAALRTLWEPTFDRYNVDLVLQGHDHSYGRSGLMRENNLLTGLNKQEHGTIYVVSVSGPKMYKLDKQPWMKSTAEQTQLYQLITIDDNTLKYEGRNALNEVHDRFTLNKRNDGSNELRVE